MNIRPEKLLEDMTRARMANFTPINNEKSHPARQQNREKDRVNTSAISNLLAKNVQHLASGNYIRQEKIDHFKSFVLDKNNFSGFDPIVDKILSNIIKS